MKYNFDEVVDRRDTASLKWDVKDGELPMWVADMDFLAAPEIREAIQKRVSHGVFGYSVIPDEWYSAYADWWKSRHDIDIPKDKMVFCTGVVPAISSLVRKLTTPAEKVLVQTPVYNMFFNCIYNNGRYIVENPLVFDGEKYSMDFDDLENKLSDPQTTLMILCNPHNPVGKIWDKETLARVGALCKKYHVTVISDEIHCDITDPGKNYVPFVAASDVCRDICVTCIAPTKTFNIAGLQTSAVYTFSEALYNKVNRGLNTDDVAEPNAFAITAAIAAFTKGGQWLDELREYLYKNKQTVKTFLEENVPDVKLISSEATYLLWLDCSAFCVDSAIFATFMREKTGLFVSKGEAYGLNGKTFLRLNIACPKVTLCDGLERLKRAVKQYKAQ